MDAATRSRTTTAMERLAAAVEEASEVLGGDSSQLIGCLSLELQRERHRRSSSLAER